MMRGTIVPAVFRKTLSLEIAATTAASALTHISTDIEAIVEGFVFFHDLWASLIELGISMWLLAVQLGPACAVPIGLSLGVQAPLSQFVKIQS